MWDLAAVCHLAPALALQGRKLENWLSDFPSALVSDQVNFCWRSEIRAAKTGLAKEVSPFVSEIWSGSVADGQKEAHYS